MKNLIAYDQTEEKCTPRRLFAGEGINIILLVQI